MNAIEVRQVSKTYRRGGLFGRRERIRAVAGVSLTIRRGTCLALVGPSGSGKSTLGRMMLGLEAPDSGEILYGGKPLGDLHGKEKRQARRRVQAVFQNSHGAVNPRFTARDVIAEPLRNFDGLRGPALDRRVAELLRRVGLDETDMGKRPHQFSGGELQRICLARALAPRPETIILDEAVSSLDLINQARILALLEAINREEGATLVFITHDMRVVAAIADAMAVMEEGRLAMLVDDLDDPAAFPPHPPPMYRRLVEAVLPVGKEKAS